MPLKPDTLAIEAAADAVAVARRWVAQVLRARALDDRVDCGQLGVSELVTNSILHAAPPLQVRLAGTHTHPRLEVVDGSERLPVPVIAPPIGSDRGPDKGSDRGPDKGSGKPDSSGPSEVPDPLSTLGRGLNLVSMASVSWGAMVESGCKVVWFEPATALHDNPHLPPKIDILVPPTTYTPPPDAVPVELLGVDQYLMRELLTYYLELKRELKLLALADSDTYPAAKQMDRHLAAFEQAFPVAITREILTVRSIEHRYTNYSAEIARSSGPVFTEVLRVFDLADTFSREKQLLSLARTPAVRAFQEWFLGEFIDQVAGATPRPWVRAATRQTVGVPRS